MKSFLAATIVSAGVVLSAALPAYAATSTCNPNTASASCTVSEGLVGTDMSNSQFNLDRMGKLPGSGSFTDYFTFSINALRDIDASYTISGTGRGSSSTKPTGVTLTLFMGTVVNGVGIGSQVTAAPGDKTSVNTPGDSIDATLTAGNYFLKVTGTSHGSAGGVGGTASFSASTVPLPNSVALFGVAVAGLGVAGAARRRSAKATAA